MNKQMENKMTKVITFGVFDYYHLGHLRLFKRAKALGDYLIVAVQDGDSILLTKPEAKILYTTEERIEMIKALRVVDEVIVYKMVDDSIAKVPFDIFAIGEDQIHKGFQKAVKWCLDNNKQVVRLPRTPGICSSNIKGTNRS